jgi:hypothetical protein
MKESRFSGSQDTRPEDVQKSAFTHSILIKNPKHRQEGSSPIFSQFHSPCKTAVASASDTNGLWLNGWIFPM